MWIEGGSCSGKSAVASSLVTKFTKEGRLGSYFFFKRGDHVLGNPASLWRTVAHDLAKFHDKMGEDLVRFLSKPGLRLRDINLHFECLIQVTLVNNEASLLANPDRKSVV